MERRSFTTLLVATVTGSLFAPVLAKTSSLDLAYFPTPTKGLPANLPDNLKQMINNVLKRDYKTINTDWDGSIIIEGLLHFAKRGSKECFDYANNWLTYHIEHDKQLSDEEYYKQYEGTKARILRDGPLTFAIYSGILGVAFPVHDLYLLTHKPVAKQICIDVADAILHYAARDRFGMLAHDDYNFTEFAIPDTTYWATRSNAIAGSLTQGDLSKVYFKQAVYQLEQGVACFLDKSNGLVRTGIFKGEPGKTYWSRSQGWLLWSISGLLRHLPESHPKFKEMAAVMTQIADALKKHQGKNGGLHVLVNDPSSPEEVTGIAMAVASIKEATRKGWIKNQYDDMLAKAWDYIKASVDKDGNVHNAYTGWAIPAEKGEVNRMDQRYRGYVPGIIMVAADEMTR